MGSRAAALVAGIIDRIEDRPLGTGRPPMPTIEVVEALRFFVREGVQRREPRAAAGRACGSTLRRRLDGWSATALLHQVHVALIRMVRSGPEAASWDVVVDSCSVRANVVPLAEKITFLKDEGEVVPGIRGLAAFGHTPGHMAFHIESEGRRLLLWADTANHYVLSVQRPDWHVRFDMDKEMAVATRRRVLDLAATDRVPVTGYHMPFPAVGFIGKVGEEYRWVPASYQLNL